MQVMMDVEKLFRFEEVSELIKVSFAAGVDLVSKSLVEHFANFGV